MLLLPVASSTRSRTWRNIRLISSPGSSSLSISGSAKGLFAPAPSSATSPSRAAYATKVPRSGEAGASPPPPRVLAVVVAASAAGASGASASPNGLSRQESRITIRIFRALSTASSSSRSETDCRWMSRFDCTVASTGTRKFSPCTSTPCPAK